MARADLHVSVLVPVHQGAADLDGCLRAIADQVWPREQLEVVIVVSARSTDGSAAVARAALAHYGVRGRVIENASGTIPANLNAALDASCGSVIVRVDVRSRPGPAHLRTIVERLADPAISVVGSWVAPVPANEGVIARAIARAHRNRLAMGGSSYRSGRGIGAVDTVYLSGCRREQLLAVGGWDERLAVNEDFDLNRRLARLGTVWCDDGLRVEWIAPSGLGSLIPKFHAYGRWKVRYWQLRSERPLRRQVVSLAAVPIAAVAVLVAASAAAGRLADRPLMRPATRLAAGLGTAVGVGAAGLVVLDGLGGRGEPAGGRERAMAALVSGMIATAWWTGVAREWLVGSPDA